MLLGKVIGTVVASEFYVGLEGVKFLIIQPLDKYKQPKGKPIIAADATAMAGPGELIYYEGGREAAMALPITFVPVDHSVIGIIDGVDLSES